MRTLSIKAGDGGRVEKVMTAQLAIQCDLFRELSEVDVLRAELNAVKESADKVRKKAFAQIGGLTKMAMEQQAEIDYLKIKLGLACAVERPLMEVLK